MHCQQPIKGSSRLLHTLPTRTCRWADPAARPTNQSTLWSLCSTVLEALYRSTWRLSLRLWRNASRIRLPGQNKYEPEELRHTASCCYCTQLMHAHVVVCTSIQQVLPKTACANSRLAGGCIWPLSLFTTSSWLSYRSLSTVPSQRCQTAHRFVSVCRL